MRNFHLMIKSLLMVVLYSAPTWSSQQNLTCKSLESLLNTVPDGRIRAFCDDATRLCIGQRTFKNLPKNHHLNDFYDKFTERLNMELKICEVGVLTFSPGFYQQYFGH